MTLLRPGPRESSTSRRARRHPGRPARSARAASPCPPAADERRDGSGQTLPAPVAAVG
ncbi:hypothetical protein [Georgenia sp. SUBG003]|uniref:hypothetical protein n=1 Tax=Georgenia sp. SUBG003 TaxID=1497974 RepID=UPI003AB835FD